MSERTHDLKRRAKRLQRDLASSKAHNDPYWIRRTLDELREVEAELAERRRARREKMGVTLPKEQRGRITLPIPTEER